MANMQQRRAWKQRTIERWGMDCWLCGTAISPRQFSLDHVVPLSKGGERWGDNLRPAHKRCNWQRSNNEPPELLLTSNMRLKVPA